MSSPSNDKHDTDLKSRSAATTALRPHQSTTYTYDDLGRLTRESEANGLTLAYTYDDNGNLLTELDATNTAVVTHSYDGFNRLISSVVGTTTITYTYNAQGIRTSRQLGSTYTQYLLDGGNVVGEVTDGTVTAYLRGANFISDGTNYYLYNAHGDVVQLTDSTGTVTKAYEYDAFGNEKNPSDTDTNPFRYCGEYYDAETGLYYLRARYYDPTVGRFTQEDTHWNTANMIYGDNPQKINEREDALGLKTYSYAPQILSIMQAGNLYVYCVDNPLFYTDPSGNSALGKLFNVKALSADGGAGGGAAAIILFPALLALYASVENGIDNLAKAVVDWVETVKGEYIYRNHSVYVLRDKFSDQVQYVGRTNNPPRREYEHRHDPNHPERADYYMTVLLTNLTKKEAALFEQLIISSYMLKYLDNARREIAVGNIAGYDKYLSSVQNIFEGAAEDIIINLLMR